MLAWYTTVIKTRLLIDSDTKKAIGHARNCGPKEWYAEHYKSKIHTHLSSLKDAKAWLVKQETKG